MNNFINIKLKAGSLYFAIILTIIFATVSLILIMFIETSIKKRHFDELKHSLVWNTRSAIDYLLCDDPDIKFGASERFGLLASSTDSIFVLRQHWGMFELCGVNVRNSIDSLKTIMLIGMSNKSERLALVLADQNRPLSLCGNALIRGNCLIPKSGVKRGYIEGVTYSGQTLIHGEKGASSRKLPQVKELLDSNFVNSQNQDFGDTLKDVFERSNSFWNNQKVINVTIQLLEKADWSGKIVIYAEHPIVIDSSVKARDVIFQAPEVRIKSGFSGNIQVFASDSIILEEGAVLKYPSLLHLKKKSPSGGGYIRLHSYSTVNGLVILDDPFTFNRSNTVLSVEDEAKVTGLIYSNNSLELKGHVEGTVYASKLILKTASSVYENHLLDATIDVISLHQDYVFPVAITNVGQREVVKWLN
ncbi:MAG: hypothetical protein WEC59_00315 [Salibacteraceae bacterium]